MPKQGLIERELSERGPAWREPTGSAATNGRDTCEPGQGLAEYAILLMSISIVLVSILTSIGGTVTSLYVQISTNFPTL